MVTWRCLVFILPLFLLTCLSGKEATIDVANTGSYTDTCADIEGASKTFFQLIPASVDIDEGESVTVKIFPVHSNSASIGSVSFDTRITNSCETEVTYYVSADCFSDNFCNVSVTDNYQAKECSEETTTASEDEEQGL